MKNRQLTFDKSLEAAHMFREALQGWLFPSLEAELGALDEKHRAFVDLCAALREHFPAARYEWCGNGKPPESRWSYFKALLAKAFWNFPSTAALIWELAARPVLRRLCGFEDPGDIPSQGNFSKVFKAFAADGTAQYVFAQQQGVQGVVARLQAPRGRIGRRHTRRHVAHLREPPRQPGRDTAHAEGRGGPSASWSSPLNRSSSCLNEKKHDKNRRTRS